MKTCAIIMISVLLAQTVRAYMYEPTLLRTHAKLAPRLFFMTKGTILTEPNRFGICIVHEKGDEKAASQIESNLLAYYPGGLNYHSMELAISDYDNVKERCFDHEMLFLLDTSDDIVNKTVNFALKHQKLTMAYSTRLLRRGVVISIHVGKKVRPIINLHAAKKSGFHFDSNLLMISKIFEP